MKTKDIQALHAKDGAELLSMQEELSLQLAKYRIQKKAGKLTNTSLVKTTADDLARVKTVIRVQQLTAAAQPVKTEAKKVSAATPRRKTGK